MSKRFMAFLVGAFVIVGAFFFWTLYRGLEAPLAAPQPAGTAAPAAPAPLPPPSVTFAVRTDPAGNALVIQWCNLPPNTVALDILRRLRKGVSPWTLWKQIQIKAGAPACDNASFDIGRDTLSAYLFSAEAVSNLTDSSAKATGQTVAWTSSSMTATVTPSSTAATSNTSGNNTTNANTAQNTATATAASSTATNGSTTATGTATITNTATSAATAPISGTPYYTPRIQLSGYGSAQTGSFWVEYVDGKIELGWQNLPTSTNAIAILRAPSTDGPWATILTQSNVNPAGPSTIQIVDDTLNQTSYYELDAEAGTDVVAVYGPVSLPPLAQ